MSPYVSQAFQGSIMGAVTLPYSVGSGGLQSEGVSRSIDQAIMGNFLDVASATPVIDMLDNPARRSSSENLKSDQTVVAVVGKALALGQSLQKTNAIALGVAGLACAGLGVILAPFSLPLAGVCALTMLGLAESSRQAYKVEKSYEPLLLRALNISEKLSSRRSDAPAEPGVSSAPIAHM